MTPLHAVAVLAAGIAAGAINTVVGSGTLITFPLLLALGYPAVTANASNAIGLVPGSVAGAIGYRQELAGQTRRATPLAGSSVVGGLIGAAGLLVLPASAFRSIVPAFILVALLLILLQPSLTRHIVRRRSSGVDDRVRAPLVLGVLVSGIYGGYFGAAQGILLLALLGLSFSDPLQRINALKVVLAGLVNLTAGVVFLFIAPIAWDAVGLIAAGSIMGGVIGARLGRRLPPSVLRAVILIVGSVALLRLL